MPGSRAGPRRSPGSRRSRDRSRLRPIGRAALVLTHGTDQQHPHVAEDVDPRRHHHDASSPGDERQRLAHRRVVGEIAPQQPDRGRARSDHVDRVGDVRSAGGRGRGVGSDRFERQQPRGRVLEVQRAGEREELWSCGGGVRPEEAARYLQGMDVRGYRRAHVALQQLFVRPEAFGGRILPVVPPRDRDPHRQGAPHDEHGRRRGDEHPSSPPVEPARRLGGEVLAHQDRPFRLDRWVLLRTYKGRPSGGPA